MSRYPAISSESLTSNGFTIIGSAFYKNSWLVWRQQVKGGFRWVMAKGNYQIEVKYLYQILKQIER